jgi:hypothetical protein
MLSLMREYKEDARMAIVINVTWSGMTPERYDEMRKLVDWEGGVPEAMLLHVAAFTDTGMRVTDIWTSQEEVQSYIDARLAPAIQQLGLPQEFDMRVLPLYRAFAPGFAGTDRAILD